MKQRISIVLCTLPTLLVVFSADITAFVISIVILAYENKDFHDRGQCKLFDYFMVVYTVLMAISLVQKISIVIIQAKSIEHLKRVLSRRYFLGLYMMNLVAFMGVTT